MYKLLVSLALLLAAAPEAHAGGCYVCGGGSAPACRDYCRYDGADTFDSRHRCEARGCRVSGATSCPSQGEAKVCQSVPSDQPILAKK